MTSDPSESLYQIDLAPKTLYDTGIRQELAAGGMASQNYGQPMPPALDASLSLEGDQSQTIRDIATDTLQQGLAGLLPGVVLNQAPILGGWISSGLDTYVTAGTPPFSEFAGHSNDILLNGDSLLIFVSLKFSLHASTSAANNLASTSQSASVTPVLYIDGKRVSASLIWSTQYWGASQNWTQTLSGLLVVTGSPMTGTDITSLAEAAKLFSPGTHTFRLGYAVSVSSADANTVSFSVTGETVFVFKLPNSIPMKVY